MTSKKEPADILKISPIIPVVVLEEEDKAVDLAKALLDGGIGIMEITLRSASALEAISRVCTGCPEMVVGAGTVINTKDFEEVISVGANFAISPGLTNSLLEFAKDSSIPLIPGISTVSELMLGLEMGISCFKFFPAEAAGGIKMLKSIAGPFPRVKFCPTGGITLSNCTDYLSLKNVLCVGGSWICPKDLVDSGNWSTITALCKEAIEVAETILRIK